MKSDPEINEDACERWWLPLLQGLDDICYVSQMLDDLYRGVYPQLFLSMSYKSNLADSCQSILIPQVLPLLSIIKQASQRNLETWKTWRFEYYLSRSRNSLEFIPKSQKTWTKHEIQKKTWIKPRMLRYTTFQYYIETIFSEFCTPVILEHLWRLPFGAKMFAI